MGIFSALSEAVQESAAAVSTAAKGVNEYAAAFETSGRMANEAMKSYEDEIVADRAKARAIAEAEFAALTAVS